jgi:vacuolar-type H+-ATPase subunit C/Vma6
MELLRRHDDKGYPSEYLLARIRGRRVHLIQDWDSVVFNSDPFAYLSSTHYGDLISKHSIQGVWVQFFRELQWLYNQMNRELRDLFKTLFLYFETKTILLCFRYKTGKRSGTEIEHLLYYSLLADKIKDILRTDSDIPTTLNLLNKIMLFPSGSMKELRDLFQRDGLKGIEQRVISRSLEEVSKSSLHPAIHSFFTYLIDSMNIIMTHKYLRWGIKSDPLFIYGGKIGESVFSRLIQAKRISGVTELTHHYTGLSIEEASTSCIEIALQRGLKKEINLMGRESLRTGFILDYLWKCFIEARNLSIILYGREIDRTILKKELVI